MTDAPFKRKRRPSWCSCTMRVKLNDGITRCGNCGRVLTVEPPDNPSLGPAGAIRWSRP